MRFPSIPFVALIMFIALPAIAHVRVTPGESKAGSQQIYSVRVPTEGKVATVSVDIEIPEGVAVVSTSSGGVMAKTGDRVTSITWKATIEPGQAREFTFEATNPSQIQRLVWKAHQHFADGSISDWVEEKGGRRPASATELR